jgi:hypothetical protein
MLELHNPNSNLGFNDICIMGSHDINRAMVGVAWRKASRAPSLVGGRRAGMVINLGVAVAGKLLAARSHKLNADWAVLSEKPAIAILRRSARSAGRRSTGHGAQPRGNR